MNISEDLEIKIHKAECQLFIKDTRCYRWCITYALFHFWPRNVPYQQWLSDYDITDINSRYCVGEIATTSHANAIHEQAEMAFFLRQEKDVQSAIMQRYYKSQYEYRHGLHVKEMTKLLQHDQSLLQRLLNLCYYDWLCSKIKE